MVCHLDAVSFGDINNDKKREVTVIGSCNTGLLKNTYAFVFIRKGHTYVLDEKLYRSLYALMDLSIEDVRKYIKSPEYLKVLEER